MNQNNTARQCHGISNCIFVSFLMFIVLNPGVVEAAVGSGWSSKHGEPECGGIVNGRLQEPCGKVEAIPEGEAVGTCPTGSFFDIGTWSCFSCPDGYNRTGFHVAKEKACSKDIRDDYSGATPTGNPMCTAASKFDSATGGFDLRKGGECWKCPADHGRTVHAVDSWRACKKGLNKSKSATFKGKACADGSILDPRNGGECWSCPEGYRRTTRSITDNTRACVKTEDLIPADKAASLSCPAGQIFDFIDGGTCWSCPAGFKRSWHGIKSDKACKTKHLKWAPPKISMPGLFGFDGAEEIAIEIIRDDPEQIDEVIEKLAQEANGDPEKWKEEQWEKLKTQPWNSAVLAAAVLERALEAAKKPTSKRSKVEKDLVKSVSAGIQAHRLFLAKQAKQASIMPLRPVKKRSKFRIKVVCKPYGVVSLRHPITTTWYRPHWARVARVSWRAG